MGAADIDLIIEWLGRIENKIDRYGERQNCIEKELAEVKSSMIDRTKLETIEQKVERHDAWINGLRWFVIAVLAFSIPAVLISLWALLTHGQPITDLLGIATPFIITATP